ncbi:hypothetical protein ACLKA6_016542 [Drosophila palustris]
MTEHEPLDESKRLPTGWIVSTAERANGHASMANNGQLQHSESVANGKALSSNGNGVQQSSEHIEAPCCRDIHGKEPPDGGARAWLVMVSAFLCNGVIFGLINTYGVLHKLLTERLTSQGDAEANSKAALVGSLAIGTTFFLSPVAGVLTDKIGLRLTTFTGGMLAAGGLFLSSFCADNISALYFTYGIMFGVGGALAYTPTLAILGHYFKRYLGKVSGFVTAGSSVFTVILPPGLKWLLASYGLESTLRVMSLMATFIIVCSFVYKPLHFPLDSPKKKNGRSRFNVALRSIVNVDIWKKKRYVIWALCVPLALFGYFVPYVHMMKFVESSFPGKDENIPVMCIGITSGIGRLIFGVIADMPRVNRMYLQQLSLVCIGALTLLLPLTSSYNILVLFALIMGLFDGCFISLLGPIAYEICGPSGATQAIGFLLGLCSLPLTIGPPVAGLIFERTGSYTLPFILAGIPPLIGSTLLFLMRCVRDESGSSITNGISSRQNGDIENSSNGTYRLNAVKSSEPLIVNGANGHALTNGAAMAVKSSAPLMGSAANGSATAANGSRSNGFADSTIETHAENTGS